MNLFDKLTKPGQKKILAIEGGGIRGAMALEVLSGIEALLRQQSGNANLVLADYFDMIAGTSTGAIIAAGLSVGLETSTLLDLYANDGALIFDRASLLDRLTRQQFGADKLSAKLQEILGADTTLGSPRIRTLLTMVMRNATTDSPWPITNNPYALYNDPSHANCNLKLPLWRLVRASAAAPAFFPPEVIDVGGKPFIFVDGGLTTYNNPSFLAFLMATVKRYWVNIGSAALPADPVWPAATGPDKLLVVSVGCGSAPDANDKLTTDEMNYIYTLTKVHSAVMYAAQVEQDMLCRVFGDCLAGDKIDRELLSMIGPDGDGPVSPKLFTYLRYTAEFSASGLGALGCADISPADVNRLDAVEAVPLLRRIGTSIVDRLVRPEHFARFPV